MNFFSGFGFESEEKLFENYLDRSEYSVGGFSLGAINALEYVKNRPSRIDKLQLFSPAFFNNKQESFKRTQLHYFQKDPKKYIQTFMQNTAYPSKVDLSIYQCQSTKEDLQKLLYYLWDEKDLEDIVKRGIKIEVYIGGKDKIIDAQVARDFFLPYGSVYFIKEGGHCLWTS